jgi:hypothetical protein
MKNLFKFTIVVTIITVIFLLNSCTNGSNAGAAFKILTDPTLRSLEYNENEPLLNDIIYSFNYKNKSKILVENPGEGKRYKIWIFNYDSNQTNKILDFKIKSKEFLRSINLVDNNLNIYTQTEINRGLSILKRTYDVSTHKKISNEIVLSMVDSSEFDIDDFNKIFYDKDTIIAISYKSFYKFPDEISFDDFRNYSTNLIFDELTNFLKGIVIFSSYKEKEDYLLIRTFDKSGTNHYDYCQHLKSREYKFNEFNTSNDGIIMRKISSPIFDKNDVLINSYIQRDTKNNFKLCVQFFKDGIIQEETYEISYGEAKYQVKPIDVHNNFKIINDKLYIFSFKSFTEYIFDLENIELINIIVYDINTKKIINQKNQYFISGDFVGSFRFFDFDVNQNGEIILLFDGTRDWGIYDRKSKTTDFVTYFQDLVLVSINESLNVEWANKVVRRGFTMYPFPSFPPNYKILPREIFSYLFLDKNGIKVKYVQTDPVIGAFENTYSYDKGELLFSKPLYIQEEEKKIEKPIEFLED